MTRRQQNVAASVKARLLNQSKVTQRPYHELLQYYAMERFLYRFGLTPHAETMALKGALMLQLLGTKLIRPTKDIDVLAGEILSEGQGRALIEDCIAVSVMDDGILFDASSIRVEPIRREQKYHGLRCRFFSYMENSRIALQIDMGFGDAAIPAPVMRRFPTLLADHPAPELLVYSIEASVSEKYEAMVSLGSTNTRFKDFFDVWFYASQHDFKGNTLQEAIRATFKRRGTALDTRPHCFETDFAATPVRQTQWKAFMGNIRQSTPRFEEATMVCRQLLLPPTEAALCEQEFTLRWQPGKGWG